MLYLIQHRIRAIQSPNHTMNRKIILNLSVLPKIVPWVPVNPIKVTKINVYLFTSLLARPAHIFPYTFFQKRVIFYHCHGNTLLD